MRIATESRPSTAKKRRAVDKQKIINTIELLIAWRPNQCRGRHRKDGVTRRSRQRSNSKTQKYYFSIQKYMMTYEEMILSVPEDDDMEAEEEKPEEETEEEGENTEEADEDEEEEMV